MQITPAPEEKASSMSQIASGPDDMEVAPSKHVQHVDAVFGEITEDGPNYRNVSVETVVRCLIVCP